MCGVISTRMGSCTHHNADSEKVSPVEEVVAIQHTSFSIEIRTECNNRHIHEPKCSLRNMWVFVEVRRGRNYMGTSVCMH